MEEHSSHWTVRNLKNSWNYSTLKAKRKVVSSEEGIRSSWRPTVMGLVGYAPTKYSASMLFTWSMLVWKARKLYAGYMKLWAHLIAIYRSTWYLIVIKSKHDLSQSSTSKEEQPPCSDKPTIKSCGRGDNGISLLLPTQAPWEEEQPPVSDKALQSPLSDEAIQPATSYATTYEATQPPLNSDKATQPSLSDKATKLPCSDSNNEILWSWWQWRKSSTCHAGFLSGRTATPRNDKATQPPCS